MPSLRDLKNRISSVTSTRKITSAMKMVAASKFRRAHEQTLSIRPYAQNIRRLLANAFQSAAASLQEDESLPPLLLPRGDGKIVLMLVVTSDRGLCGAFNSNAIREARRRVKAYAKKDKHVKIFCVGRKGRDALKRDFGDAVIDSMLCNAKGRLSYDGAEHISKKIISMYEANEIDSAIIIFNKFNSAISQEITVKQLLPISLKEQKAKAEEPPKESETPVPEPKPETHLEYLFEPSPKIILEQLLPRYVGMQVFSTILESIAGEQGARMTAMDNATRNAGDMINKLTLNYNRSRQAFITKELIEIISGAEAV